MKNILFLAVSIFCLISTTKGTVYIIGNDTIHRENEIYYVIYQADTFYIDTSLIFIKYHNSVDP